MRGRINTWLQRLWSHRGLGEETVPVSACVHYGAFRYGRGEYNPYEAYLVELVRDGEARSARRRFLGFLQHYRPRHLGEALGVKLTQAQPLWRYPWSRGEPVPAWVERPEDCPDILTHFMPAGVPRRRVEQEFQWLEQALDSIRRNGYQPRRFNNTVLARKLVRSDGTARYLLLDGNHRVAAMVALGIGEVALSCPPWLVVRESGSGAWPQVRRGTCAQEDAQRIFHAYFEGNVRPRTTEMAVPVWEESP